MPAKTRGRQVDPAQVFLNVPYSNSYERTLVGLTAALVALRRVPRLTFQVPDGGQGRLRRIFELMQSCRVSFHDLSAVGLPVRFNMPFELGLAFVIKQQSNQHDFLILEKESHRVQKTLSDLNGIDPKIHHGTVRGAVSAVLEVLERPEGNPSTAEVMRLYRQMMPLVPQLKKQHGNKGLFNTRVYGELVASGWIAAQKMGMI